MNEPPTDLNTEPLHRPDPGSDCDVCHDEPSVGVAAVPGVPMSVAYGARCLAANAHPYDIVVINTSLVGGYDSAADWWKELVDATLTHLGKDREQFDRDVDAEILQLELEL